jgi:hypothetical protein
VEEGKTNPFHPSGIGCQVRPGQSIGSIGKQKTGIQMKTINQTPVKASLGKRLAKDTDVFQPIHYIATGIGNWYEQDLQYFCDPSFPPDRLPAKVQVEYILKAKILSDYLLTFKNQSGYIKALTGLRKTIFPDWYYGDLRTYHDSQTCFSLILVHFSPDRTMFRMYLFEGLYPDCKKRITIISKMIQEIIHTGRPTRESLCKRLRKATCKTDFGQSKHQTNYR